MEKLMMKLEKYKGLLPWINTVILLIIAISLIQIGFSLEALIQGINDLTGILANQ
ncbi:hypothetical protein [Bacillus seohaeanensis]|uniref:Uncharacterized protein n=1 Tax=Bacillus seohaeanensis TaxID=284580 RepID=A0ABW5RKI5_9BACI